MPRMEDSSFACLPQCADLRFLFRAPLPIQIRGYPLLQVSLISFFVVFCYFHIVLEGAGQNFEMHGLKDVNSGVYRNRKSSFTKAFDSQDSAWKRFRYGDAL